jgi:RNA polymerase sigma factor (sigma-70 family)
MKGKKKEKKVELEGVLNPQPTSMAADKSVSGSAKPAVGDSWIDLVNSLQTSSGSDTKPLLDLQDRYMGLVDEALRHGNVKDWNDRQDLRQMVFFKFWQMLQMPKGTRGAWDPGRSRFSTDPVATMLSKIARSRAIDFHRGRVRGRRKHDAYADDRSRFGEAVSDYAVAGAGRRRKTFLACTNPSAERKPEAALRRYVSEVAERVPAAVAKLPPEPRRILALRTDGQSVRQIGRSIGVSAGEASRRLTDARNQARNEIRQTC